MLGGALNSYKSSFKDLSPEIWWLSLITFINRAGTMIIPFLSVYLNAELGFSLPQIGWIMTVFGLGGFVGSYLGGKLTDIFGYYKVMAVSIIASGVLFILLQYADTYLEFCLGIFIITVVSDSYRPASFVAMSAYSKPGNKTRAVTLIRLAINLGFSFGPAVGGFIIVSMSYNGLFWVDGITCILAGLLLLVVLNPKKAKESSDTKAVVDNPQSAYKDGPFLLMLLGSFFLGFAFMQLFSSVPLFYKNIHGLSENYIGWLLGLNGVIIFVTEMPLIFKLENSRFSKTMILFYSSLFLGLGFLILAHSWIGILIVSMIFITVGEMLAFPFSNSLVMDRSERGLQGQYMGLYTMTFSVSHILGPNIGLQIVELWGYDALWYIIFAVSVLAAVIFMRCGKYFS